MRRVNVVVTYPLPEDALAALRAAHTVTVLRDPAELRSAAPGADAVVTMLNDTVDAELLDAAGPQLRVVANVAVGFDNIDLAACAARGIVVSNTPHVLTDATADLTWALILMVSRRCGEAERFVRSGAAWRWAMDGFLGRSLQNKTLGIVGLGSIGTAVARRAQAFGMRIAYSGNHDCAPELAAELDARRLSLDELLATADVVSLHCPYRPSTHHLLGQAELARMKPSAYLINTARGALVDEAALLAALREGTIAGAGLDVYEHEPDVPPELLVSDKVVLLPHIGSGTVETRTVMARLAADNVLAVLRGEDALTPVPGPPSRPAAPVADRPA